MNSQFKTAFTNNFGDYLAVATGNVSIACSPPSDDIFKAAHAGLTEDEMNVPFIVYDCGNA